MRVHLSPWQVAETTFRLPSLPLVGKRRRPRTEAASGATDRRRAGENNGDETRNHVERHDHDASHAVSDHNVDDHILEEDEFFPVEVSFISDKKRTRSSEKERKARQAPRTDEMMTPVFMLTGSHRIVVVGRPSRPGNRPLSEDPSIIEPAASTASYQLEESSTMDYTSQLDSSAAFLPERSTSTDSSLGAASRSQDRSNHTRILGGIPAVMDTKQDRIYAFQRNNTRLMSWHTSAAAGIVGRPKPASSPAAHPTLSVDMEAPATSLALLHLPRVGSTLLYGSCQDGRIFLVQPTEEAFHVHYMDTKTHAEAVPGILGTVAYVIHSRSPSESLTPLQESSSYQVVIVQLRQDEHGVALWRIHLTMAKGIPLQESLKRRPHEDSIVVAFPPSIAKLGCSLESIRMLAFHEEDVSVTLQYSLATASPTSGDQGEVCSTVHRKRFCGSVSLQDATWLTAPFLLPAGSRQACSVAHNLLVVGARDGGILFFDMMRCAPVVHHSLKNVQMDHDRWVLVTEPKRSRLLILFTKGNTVCAALTTVHVDGGRWSTADTLATAISFPTSDAEVLDQPPRKRRMLTLTHRQCSLVPLEEKEMDTIDRALEFWRMGCAAITEKSSSAASPGYLLEVYEKAMAALGLSLARESPPPIKALIEGKKEEVLDNPQDAVPSRKNTVNGVHWAVDGHKILNGVYGHSNMISRAKKRAHTPRCVPERFVQQVLSTLLTILGRSKFCAPGTARDDARLLLRRLVRSGNVSARIELVPVKGDVGSFARVIESLEMMEGEEISSYTPIDLIYDMLRCCHDVSERHMVIALRYLLTKAKGDDIALCFIRNKYLVTEHPFKALGDRYVTVRGGSKGTTGKFSEELRALSSQLMLSSIRMLLTSITNYSDCNESLVRSALNLELSQGQVGLVTRLCAEMLSDPKDRQRSAVSLSRTVEWISALCDCLHGPLEETVSHTVLHVRSLIAAEISKTEAIVSLREPLGAWDASMAAGGGAQSKKASLRARESVYLPPYQIERLVL